MYLKPLGLQYDAGDLHGEIDHLAFCHCGHLIAASAKGVLSKLHLPGDVPASTPFADVGRPLGAMVVDPVRLYCLVGDSNGDVGRHLIDGSGTVVESFPSVGRYAMAACFWRISGYATFVVGTAGGQLYFYGHSDGGIKHKHVTTAHGGSVMVLLSAPLVPMLFSCGRDGVICGWEMGKEGPVQACQVNHGCPFRAADMLDDGSAIVTLDDALRVVLWRLARGGLKAVASVTVPGAKCLTFAGANTVVVGTRGGSISSYTLKRPGLEPGMAWAGYHDEPITTLARMPTPLDEPSMQSLQQIRPSVLMLSPPMQQDNPLIAATCGQRITFWQLAK